MFERNSELEATILNTDLTGQFESLQIYNKILLKSKQTKLHNYGIVMDQNYVCMWLYIKIIWNQFIVIW